MDICHIAGKTNHVANALSCIHLCAVFSELGMDFMAMAEAQQDDTDIASLHSGATGLMLQCLPFGFDSITLCDVSTGQWRPVMPTIFRHSVFKASHNLLHSQYLHHLLPHY